MDLACMCVKHQMRLYVCQTPNAFICVSPNAFTCVSPNVFAEFGARFARSPLLASLARFFTV